MRAFILFLAAASACFAQAERNVITVTASRQLNIQPDQVSLTVDILSDGAQTLDNVLAFLQGTNITAADLSSVRTQIFDVGPPLEWVFTPTVSFAELSSVLAALSALSSFPADGPITLDYFFLSATTSPQAIAAQPCPYPALINDAQTQAEKLAAAAGVSLGPILSLAQGAAKGTASSVRTGDFSALYANSDSVGVALTLIVNVLATSNSTPSCFLTVQFNLGQ